LWNLQYAVANLREELWGEAVCPAGHQACRNTSNRSYASLEFPEDLPQAGMFAPGSAMENAMFKKVIAYARNLVPRLNAVPFDEVGPDESVN
jgi:hypothetical protein